jgi:hypothetical protein
VSGQLVLYDHGEFFHVGCRSRTIQSTAFDEVDRAQRAVRRIEEAKRHQASLGKARPRQSGEAGVCPVCGHPALLTDWRPTLSWMAVERCFCGGFFVWTALLQGRLDTLDAAARSGLSDRIRAHRAAASEAWCTTSDGTVSGPLVIRSERPDRPT